MSGEFRTLSAEEITDYLSVLLDRLAARGVTVTGYIVGGVAVAIQLGRDERTPDIDGFFRPQTEVFAEAAAMAAEFDLNPDWINAHAAGFIEFDPADDYDAQVIVAHGHRVAVASPRVLLAMKIASLRPKDRGDISRLILHLDITDPDEIVDLAFSVFGEDSIALSAGRDDVRIDAAEAIDRAQLYAARGPAGPRPTLVQGRLRRGAPGGRGGEFMAKVHQPPEMSLSTEA